MSDVAVRKPPVDEIMAPHGAPRRGWCRWCGKVVKEKTAHHKLLKFWHDKCEETFHIIIRPDSARRAVLARDRGICANCGEDWSEKFKLVPANYASPDEMERWPSDTRYTHGPDGKRFVRVEYAWEGNWRAGRH